MLFIATTKEAKQIAQTTHNLAVRKCYEYVQQVRYTGAGAIVFVTDTPHGVQGVRLLR